MSSSCPQVHFFCGKIGSGKSTLAAEIASESGAILISEDNWTSTLWPNELESLEDYREKSARLKKALWPLASQVLQAGTSLVLDFPANTVPQRRTLKALVDMAGVSHTLHLLDTPGEVCKARLKARNAAGEHAYQVTEEQFEQFSSFFVPPAEEEALNVKVWCSSE